LSLINNCNDSITRLPAMSIHLLFYALAYIIGSLAIPKDAEGYYGNYGTIGTCTAQGFVIWFCQVGALMYYGFLSVYSYVAVLAGFQRRKYEWVEKWLHMIVFAYPLGIGIWVLMREGFNPGYGFCKQGSYPRGCNLDKDVECERGPHYTGIKGSILTFGSLILFIVIPTTLMAVLYCKVKGHERQVAEEGAKPMLMKSRDVAIQSCLYLATTYWTILPYFVVYVFQFFMEGTPEEHLATSWILVRINFALFGFWSLLCYRHFSVERVSCRGATNKSNSTLVESEPSGRETTTTTDFIFNVGSSRPFDDSFQNTIRSDSHTIKTVEKPQEEPEERRFSFNIFDGTNASGAYADFIFDGDSDDEQMDKEEAEKWKGVQDHI